MQIRHSYMPRAVRVGMVSSFMPPHLGGLEVVAESIYEAYRSAGFEVRWIASWSPIGAVQRENGKVRVRCWNVLEDTIGVPWPIWGLGGIRAAGQLADWADIIHVHDCLYASSAIAVWLGRRAKKPILLSQHIGHSVYSSPVLNWIQNFAYRTMGRAILRRVSHIAFCNDSAEEYISVLLNDLMVSSTKIPPGIDTERFRPPSPMERVVAQQGFGLPTSSPVVLFVGRLQEKKGAGLFYQVVRRMPWCHFFVVGDGPKRPPDLVNLIWVQFVDPSRMELVYHAADVLVLLSYSESFSLTLHEAVASGLPVLIAGADVGPAWLQSTGMTKRVRRDAESIEVALTLLLHEPNRKSQEPAEAREFIESNCGLARMRREYTRLILELLGVKP